MSVDATRFVWKLSKEVITPIEKLILLAIADRCGEQGECWPSVARLEKDTGLDRRSIMRHRSKLINQGILQYTGDFKGRCKQIPVMKLMVDEWREGDYVEDDIEGGHTVTRGRETQVGGAACHGEGGQPVTQNLKEEPKKESNTLCASSSKSTLCAFESFWELYPTKKAKKKCSEIWKRRKLDKQSDEILKNMGNQIENDDHWKRGYIPNPSTYLNQDRWTDEVTLSKQSIEAKEHKEKVTLNEARLAEQERLTLKNQQYEQEKHHQYNQDGAFLRSIINQVMPVADKGIPAGFKELKKILGLK